MGAEATRAGQHRRAYAALAGASVLWGASFPLGKLALGEMGAATLVFCRFVLAAAVLLPVVRWREVRWARRDTVLLVVCAVLCGPGMFLLQFEGLDRTTASSAALLVATAPPMMAVAATLFDGERPGRLTWVAVGLATLGALLLIGAPGPGRTLLGDTLVFVSMGIATAWTLVVRRLARRVGALAATAAQFALAAAVLVPFLWALDGVPSLSFSSGAWAAVLGLGLGCTALTFFLWNWGLLHAEAARAGVFVNLEPLVGAALGVAFLGEVLGPLAVAGGAVLLAAAFLATRPDRVPAAP
ncbi:MAG: EamA family transporter [Bacteroidota bacterium]